MVMKKGFGVPFTGKSDPMIALFEFRLFLIYTS